MRVSQEPGGLLRGFHAPVPLVPPPRLCVSPLSCLRAPPVSQPACLLPGKPPPWQPAGIPRTCTRGKERFLPLAEAVGGSALSPKQGPGCDPRKGRGGRRRASLVAHSTDDDSAVIRHLLFLRPCAGPVMHNISLNCALSLRDRCDYSHSTDEETGAQDSSGAAYGWQVSELRVEPSPV